MDIVRFSPFEGMDSLRRQLDRVFADIENSTQDSCSTWTPAIELLDSSDNLILRIQLAGIDRKKIDIEVTRKSVTLSGERHLPEIESSHCLHSEFDYGKFQRKISLPVPVINSQVKASYEEGLLTLVLPKIEEAKHRVVKITIEDNVSATASLPETEFLQEQAELVSV